VAHQVFAVEKLSTKEGTLLKQFSLLYHDVLRSTGDSPSTSSGFSGADAESYKLDASLFANHLEIISQFKPKNVQTLSKFSILPSEDRPWPIQFTFDDGGSSAHEIIADMLEEKGWKGNFFIVTARIGQTGFMSKPQIQDLHRRGHHIGSHSHTHPSRFSHLSRQKIQEEWRISRTILSDLLGEPVRSASVPGGYYSRVVAEAAREVGYSFLFNSEPTTRVKQVGSLIVLGRFGIRRTTSSNEALALVQSNPMARWKQSLVWNAKKPIKILGGEAWITFRRWIYAQRSQ
jgi:peptidoglycan/xylan/chitin deacetylase (PgdA/CDA1 family)